MDDVAENDNVSMDNVSNDNAIIKKDWIKFM